MGSNQAGPQSPVQCFFLIKLSVEGISGTAVFIFNRGKNIMSLCHLIKSYLTFKLLQM